MKLLLKPLLVIIFSGFFAGSHAQTIEYKNKLQDVNKRTEWFRNARFGMFIHWGVYAGLGRGEWVKSNEKITTEAYQKHVDAFLPSNYNPTEWAAVAKEAGMKYAVMTAKHHDGFCMFDSKLTDYKISKNLPNRDFIKEYADAFRKAGLRVGFYYSLIDWHHKDYPNVGNHPMRENKEYTAKKYNWDNYIQYMHGQIEELMTNYGKIDVLWLDYSFDTYQGEKWKAEALLKMIKKHQPDIIINNRLVVNHGVSNKKVEFEGYGDFLTPEQSVPDEKMTDKYGNEIPWETCLTLNNSWGFSSADISWKSADMLINALVTCVSRNGNLLLNVGPDNQGTIPEQSKKILKKVGEWMKNNGESIYGCKDVDYPKPHWGYYTKSGNILYAHLTNPIIGHLNIGGLGKDVTDVTVLNTKEKAATNKGWWGNQDGGNFFINVKQPTYLTHDLPDETDTVFKIVMGKK